MISPIEILGQIIGRQKRRLIRILRQPKPTPDPQMTPLELGGRQVGEPGDAVDRRGIELLVPPRPAQVIPEHLEPAIVLFLGGVRLAEAPLEEGEVAMIGREVAAIRGGVVHDLPDQQRIAVDLRRSAGRDEDENEGEREEGDERERAIHGSREKSARQNEKIWK